MYELKTLNDIRFPFVLIYILYTAIAVPRMLARQWWRLCMRQKFETMVDITQSRHQSARVEKFPSDYLASVY